MWRGFLAAAIAYGCGHPSLDGYRPAAINVPLQTFYQQINMAAHEGLMALASVNNARAQYIKTYMASAERQLRGSEKLIGSAGDSQAPAAPSATE